MVLILKTGTAHQPLPHQPPLSVFSKLHTFLLFLTVNLSKSSNANHASLDGMLP